ncbi:hypothetical protein BJ165DRAFT_164898 [Panaeolus papilionaceus]|nr:hypothetical protein BJ165DRAFT_164898 [Panaeolus papilionaceus]
MLYPSPKRVQNAFKRETAAQKACPLDVSFVCGEWTKSLEQQGAVFKLDIPKYWDIFIHCMERWNSIAIWAPFVPTMHLQKKGIPELNMSAPNLKHVMLVGPREFNVVATAQFLSPLWKTSPLDSFYIKQVTEDPYDSAGGLLFNYVPTGCLTQLKLDCKLSVIECCLLLAFSPNLVECSFGDIAGPIGDTNIAFACQELQSLRVVVDYEDHHEGRDTYLWAILDQLTVPKLRRFVVECDDRWQNTSFLAFLDRSQCVLEALEFLLVRIDPDGFMQVLQKCRHLRVLMYKPDYTQTPTAISPEVLKALDPEGNSPFELLEDLEILALNEDALGGLQDGQFAEALRKKLHFDDLNIFRLCVRSAGYPP